MAQTDYDLITIGGGIAAASLAKVMAEADKRVLVLERETIFKDRVRGEFMVPWGLAEAQALGVEQALREAGAHDLPKFEFRLGSPGKARDFTSTTPQQLPALSFYHPAAQEALLSAAAQAGAEVRRGVAALHVQPGSPPQVEVREGDGTAKLSARLIVGADGRNAMSRRSLDRKAQHEREPRLLAGLLLDDVAAAADTFLATFDLSNGRMGLIIPQGAGRVRAYLSFRGDDAQRLDGPDAYARFVEACVGTGIAAETFAEATVQGPLATFDCDDNFVPHPHRAGVVLIGDAAATTDPTWGQGLSLGFRDTRVLSEQLLSGDDWPAAADGYAEEHDRYVDVTIRTEGWRQQVFLDGGLEADRRRQRALPLIVADPTRIPDHGFSGPDLPAGDDVRRRFFGEE